MVRKYELMVLLSGQSTQEDVKSFVTHIEKLVAAKKGAVESTEMLGRRTLAFAVKKQKEGYYVLFRITIDGAVAQDFDRDIRLTESVLRHLFIVYDEKKQHALELAGEQIHVPEEK